MLKDGDLQNLSKVGPNMCFTADFYHWKSNVSWNHACMGNYQTCVPNSSIHLLRKRGGGEGMGR